MTGDTSRNIFFGRGKINTLILDAHTTFRHLNVHEYGTLKVDELE